MDRVVINISDSPENQRNESPPTQQIEDTELRLALNASSMNSVGRGGNVFRTSNVLAENPGDSPLCANLLGDMEGSSQSHFQVMRDNDDDDMTRSLIYNNHWMSQMARSSLNNGGSTASGSYPQALGGSAALTTQFHDYTVNNEDVLDSHPLSGISERHQVDINTTNSRGTQCSPFQVPQTVWGNAGFGDSAVAGEQVHSQGGTGTDTQHIHDFPSHEVGFPSLFANNCSQIERASTSSRSNRPHMTRRNNRAGAAIGGARSIGHDSGNVATQSHNLQNPQINRSAISIGPIGAAVRQESSRRKTGRVGCQSFRINGDSDTSIPSLPSSSLGEHNNRCQVGLDGGFTPRTHVDSREEDMDGIDLVSNALFLNGIQNAMADENSSAVGVNSPELEQSQIHEKLMTRRNVKINDSHSNSTNQSSGVIRPEQTDNSFLNLGFSGNATVGVRSIASGTGFSSDTGCPKTTQSHTIEGPQTYGKFLSLGGYLDGQTLSNNANAIISGTNAGVSLNPYRNVGGNMGNLTWSNNASRVMSVTNADANAISGTNAPVNLYRTVGATMVNQIWSNNASRVISATNADPDADAIVSDTNTGVSSNLYRSVGEATGDQARSSNAARVMAGTNAGVMSNPFTIPQTVQGNVNQCVSRPSGRTLQPGDSGHGMSVNAVPIRGSHGNSVGVPRPFNSRAGLVAIEQARVSGSPVGPNSMTGILNRPFTTPLQSQQSYMNNAMHIAANSSIAPSLDSAAGRTSQHDQSGHNVPAEHTIAEAANTIQSDNSKPAQPDQGTARISRRGKRVPADGIQYAQSAKVQLGPSASGKPVPLAGADRLAQTPESPVGQTSQNVPNASAARQGRRGRKTAQPTPIPPTASGNPTRPVYHLKWKAPTEVYESNGENCCLCKRDLIFTATGTVTQPPTPPPVAVLPCGHTFHDECLERITPETELKNPPCIPCAIGNV